MPFASLWLARKRGAQDGTRRQPQPDATSSPSLDYIRRNYEVRILKVWGKWTDRNRRLLEQWCEARATYRRISETAEAAWDRIEAREREPVSAGDPEPEPVMESEVHSHAAGESADQVAAHEASMALLRQRKQQIMDELSGTGPGPFTLGRVWARCGSLES